MKSPWWTIGWRNMGRSRRRTFITAAALAGGYFSIVILVGLSRGIVAEMIGNGTDLTAGQLQVHNADYLPDKSIYDTFGGTEGNSIESMVALVESDPAVQAAAPRVYAGGLIGSETYTVPGQLMGIDVDREPSVSRIVQVDEGRLPTPGMNEAVLGGEMARQLEVGIGDELVVVAPSIDGSMGNDLFTVVGIYNTGIVELDATTVIVALDALQYLVYMDEERIHEIAAVVADPWDAPAAADRINVVLGDANLNIEAIAWTELRPELVDYANLVRASEFVVVIVVFGMAIFGVANTMLMATYERRREFALLLALGATPWGVIKSVLAEAIALGILSIVAGMVITAPFLVWWHVAPLDLSFASTGFSMSGSYVSPVLRVEYPWSAIFVASVSLFGTALLAATYPAIRSARLPAADTLAGR
jgi:ABC-type lipoprotein release transport system permease subunit